MSRLSPGPNHRIDQFLDPEPNLTRIESCVSGDTIPVPPGSITRFAFLPGDFLGVILVHMVPLQHGRNVIQWCQGWSGTHNHGIILRMRVGVGDQDIENDLVEQFQGIDGRKVVTRQQETFEVNARPCPPLIFLTGIEPVGLGEVFLMQPFH